MFRVLFGYVAVSTNIGIDFFGVLIIIRALLFWGIHWAPDVWKLSYRSRVLLTSSCN